MRTTFRLAALLLATAAPLAALDSRKPSAALEIDHDFARPAPGVAGILANLRERPAGSDLEEMARALVANRAVELGLAVDSGLELHAIRHGKAVHVVRFRQTFAGLPVLRGSIAISFNRHGEAIFVANDLKPLVGDTATLSDTVGRGADFASASARASVLAHLGIAGALNLDRSELAILPGAERARLVWAVRLEARDAPYGDWEALVDAESGELLRVEDRAHYGTDGQGFAYLPDPLASADATYGDPGYVDGGDADTPQLLAQIFEVTLPDLAFETGAFRLKGPYAECVDWASPFIGCASDVDGDFTNPPAPSRSAEVFEDQHVYHHIDAFMRYMNATLGVVVDPYQYAGGVQFDAHGWDDNDNSSYSSGTGRLRFGDGGVDDAEDTDVVIHELGHGVHDWVTSGGLSQVNGLSEGVGDYLAASYSRRVFPGTWTPADVEWDWVFKWDGHNPFWPGRLLDWNDNHLYNTGIPPTHSSGQFWSSCNLDIAEVIGYAEMDEAFLEGLSMTNGGTNQAGAAQAVIQAAAELGYSSATLTTMAALYNDASGGFGCNYGVASEIFSDSFNSGNTDAWDLNVVEP